MSQESTLPLRRLVRAIATFLAVTTAVLVPIGYGLISAGYELDRLSFSAEMNASRVSRYIYQYGSMWPFHRVRLAELIELSGQEHGRTHQRIVTSAGKVVLEEEGELPAPILTRSAPIGVGQEVVGRLEVQTSARPLLLSTFVVALFSFGIAVIAIAAVRLLPLLALDRAIARLNDRERQLRVKTTQLAASEDRLDRALKDGHIVLWELEVETGSLRYSGDPWRILDVTPGTTRDFESYVHPDDQERRRAALDKAATDGIAYAIELRLVRPGGATVWIRDTVEVRTGLDQHRSVCGIMVDITAQKAAQAEAQQKADLLERTLENMDQGLIMVDPDQRVLVCSRRAMDLLDLPPDLMASAPSLVEVQRHQIEIGDRPPALVSPDPGSPRSFTSDPNIYERTRPNGIVLEVRTVVLPDQGAVRTFTDITLRRHAERELRESEARYRALVDAGVSVVWRADPSGIILAAEGRNASAGRLVGESIGQGWIDRVHPEDRAKVRAVWSQMQASLEPASVEYRTVGAGSSPSWIKARAVPLRNPDGSLREWVGTLTDITQEHHLEAQLRQAQKMEAIGQFTGGIAHDFNNLLAVIMGNAELLVDDPAQPLPVRRHSELILLASEKAADLTGRLLALGRRQTLKVERVPLGEAIEELEPFLRRSIGKQVELKIVVQPVASAALTDRALLESAVLNLVVNARDALPQGGTITITTGERSAGLDEGSIPAGQPVVFVTVADDGTGMTPDVLKKVFEPFFTTKEVGKGSGLGLSIVHGFAAQSGGHVRIDTSVGQGTAVTILLRAVSVASDGQGSVAPDQIAASGCERVLLVEDEPHVRDLICSQLVGLGYRVTAVGSGEEALDHLRQDRAFDLLFTDVVLQGGVSGVELVLQARTIRPDLKVLLTSGYPEEVFEEHGRPSGDTLLLRKPFKRKELAETIRRSLDAGPTSLEPATPAGRR